MKRASLIVTGLMLVTVFLWSTPFLWTLVASFRPDNAGGIRMASLVPDYKPTWENFAELAFESGNFAVYYVNTAIVAFGIPGRADRHHLAGTGYAFAAARFPPAATSSSTSSCCSSCWCRRS